ncbi:protein TIFY 5A-like [Cucurbita pepo subsp. pepo]|uniref:protein TIFY 5A-like n=1 Tax=Cucurbita pepo subsp. pepo TaxID=3664 RepID=UPI000C9D555B|nr:protein TIFY 5A-like [Cucurbita pepo subsp. pepo]
MENILNCNLELCLSPPSSSPSTATATANSTSTSCHNHIDPTRVPIPDLTELQARAIIVRATTQMEVERRLTTCHISSPKQRVSMKSGASPSMRRSLQRFLQKRKHRIQTLSPYSH